MAWRFENPSDQKLLLEFATREAVSSAIRNCGLMFIDYSPDEYGSAVKFLKLCKKQIDIQMDENIREYEKKAKGE